MDRTLPHLFRQSSFVKLWTSQILQSLANVLLQVSVMVQVYQQTHSVFRSSMVWAVMALGPLVRGILGSRYIDRFSLARLLSGIEWFRARFTLLLALLLLQNHLQLFLPEIVLFVIALIGAWYHPARFALLPLVVSKQGYMKANGILNLIHQLFLVAGWGLGGMIAAVFPFYAVVLIIFASFLLSGESIR